MQNTTLYLPNKLHLQLKVTAKRQNKSQAELIREVLKGFIEEQPRRVPKSIGAGESSDVTSEDIDDWLKKNWIKDLELDNG
ncbi:MAG: CopG family transcriptional regulator [Deinococcota bacterium]|jgi:plasmid stability protein|nr:CopG family transcriptional regulator [Deinococcota bacterium]